MLRSALALTALCGVVVRVLADIKPYDFYTNPEDWPKLCFNGRTQSPIDLPTSATDSTALPRASAVNVQMPQVSRPKIINKGNVLQVWTQQAPVRMRGSNGLRYHVHAIKPSSRTSHERFHGSVQSHSSSECCESLKSCLPYARTCEPALAPSLRAS